MNKFTQFLLLLFCWSCSTGSQNQNDETAAVLATVFDSEAIWVDDHKTRIEGKEAIQNKVAADYPDRKVLKTLHQISANPEFDYKITEFKTKNGAMFRSFSIDEKSQAVRLFEFSASYTSELEMDTSIFQQRRADWMRYCNGHEVTALVENVYAKDALYFNHKPLVIGRNSIINEYQYMNNPSYQLSLNPICLVPFNRNWVVEIGQCTGGYNGKYVLIWNQEADGQWNIYIDSNI